MKYLFLVAVCTLSVIRAEDWPQFLGPHRNGTYAGDVATNWPSEGPKTHWRKNVGTGFASPVVAGNTLILFHKAGSAEQLLALDRHSGNELWRNSYPSTFDDDFGVGEGPRATPSISDGKVYSVGADGMITCAGLADGKTIWQVNAKKEFRIREGFFGVASSPLVEGNLILLNIGGADNAGIVALNTADGKLKWKTSEAEASYSSPVSGDLNGQRRAVFFTREGLAVLDPQNGDVDLEFPWRSKMHASVNAAVPLVIGNRIFLSASYGTGAILLEADGGKVEEIWSGDDILSNHYATSVHRDGRLYGFDGRQEMGASLACVDLATGKTLWREERIGAGTITSAKNALVVLLESGELLVIAAADKKFMPLARSQILGSTLRAYPALVDGMLYARDKSRLIAVQIGK